MALNGYVLHVGPSPVQELVPSTAGAPKSQSGGGHGQHLRWDISRRHPSIAKRLRRFVEATHRAAEKALWDHGPLILPGSGVPLPDFPGFGALCLKGAVSPELGTPEASFTTLLNGVIIHI